MSKTVTEPEADLDASEEASRPSLSDFLSHGLRESQRPPSMRPPSMPPAGPVAESQAPETPPAAESEPDPPVAAPAFSAASSDTEDTTDAPDDTSAGGAGVDCGRPSGNSPRDEPVEEAPPSPRRNVVIVEHAATESEADYTVPVGLPPRRRLIAGAVALSVIIFVFGVAWWSSRAGHQATHPPAPSHRETVPVTHEPLPPPPPPVESSEPNMDIDFEESVQAPKAGGAPAAAESSAEPPANYGPNVARYPDLPTPVLIELEKAQQEGKKTKQQVAPPQGE